MQMRFLERKYIVGLLLMLPLAVLPACGSDDETEDVIAEIQENKENGEFYLAEVRERENVKSDPSGLLYEVLTAAQTVKPGENDTVCIHYDGFLIDGTQFISKTDTIAMEELQKGLQIGLRHTHQGSTCKYYIPYYLMFGASGKSCTYGGKEISIKEYSSLVYEMRLDSIIFVR